MSSSPFKNVGICGICGEEIESTHRHDFKQCECGNLFVDGGRDYQRFGYDPSRETGVSLLWNNITEEWVTIKDIECAQSPLNVEADISKQKQQNTSSDLKSESKSRKLMILWD